MKKASKGILLLCILFSIGTASNIKPAWAEEHAIKAPVATKELQARALLLSNDYLGFRIYVKKLYEQKLNFREWFYIKNLISSSADRVGYDLITFWNARNKSAASDIDNQLFKVEKLNRSGQFEEAFTLAQSVAEKVNLLQKTRVDAKFQMPFIFHSMGRALYGARRYDDAVKVYQWIGSTYPYFVQVLFEKMWAAFKAGRVDIALGAIASQRSAYFNRYLQPEAYLVQTYLYRRLCRDEDQQQIVAEMKEYQNVLSNKDAHLSPIIDVSTLTLSNLSKMQVAETHNLQLVSEEERKQEQNVIKAALQSSVNSRRERTLKDLKDVIAYQQLSGQNDSKTVLKPVGKMISRDELLKQDLEVWPADTSEEWIDEVGKHVLIGESHCTVQK